MEIAMNKRAFYALLTGATLVFNTHTFAGEEGGDVAMRDLPLKSDQNRGPHFNDPFEGHYDF